MAEDDDFRLGKSALCNSPVVPERVSFGVPEGEKFAENVVFNPAVPVENTDDAAIVCQGEFCRQTEVHQPIPVAAYGCDGGNGFEPAEYARHGNISGMNDERDTRLLKCVGYAGVQSGRFIRNVGISDYTENDFVCFHYGLIHNLMPLRRMLCIQAKARIQEGFFGKSTCVSAFPRLLHA